MILFIDLIGVDNSFAIFCSTKEDVIFVHAISGVEILHHPKDSPFYITSSLSIESSMKYQHISTISQTNNIDVVIVNKGSINTQSKINPNVNVSYFRSFNPPNSNIERKPGQRVLVKTLSPKPTKIRFSEVKL